MCSPKKMNRKELLNDWRGFELDLGAGYEVLAQQGAKFLEEKERRLKILESDFHTNLPEEKVKWTSGGDVINWKIAYMVKKYCIKDEAISLKKGGSYCSFSNVRSQYTKYETVLPRIVKREVVLMVNDQYFDKLDFFKSTFEKLPRELTEKVSEFGSMPVWVEIRDTLEDEEIIIFQGETFSFGSINYPENTLASTGWGNEIFWHVDEYCQLMALYEPVQ